MGRGWEIGIADRMNRIGKQKKERGNNKMLWIASPGLHRLLGKRAVGCGWEIGIADRMNRIREQKRKREEKEKEREEGNEMKWKR